MATCPACRKHYADDVATCADDGEALLPDEAFLGEDAPLEAGTMVGEYRIEGKIGEGGFGTVYRAVQPLIGKAVALKVLSRQYSTNPQMVSRFIAEARAVNQIRHRNIIDIFSFGTLPDGRQYFVMELLQGMPFDKYLAEHGPLAPEMALGILRPIARALDAAHQASIVHRDLKPENVFLCFDDEGVIAPKLLDFGIAKLTVESGPGHKTRTGTPMGTPSYMSPEQCRGMPVDGRTDVYSFGVMCHEVLTGRPVFDGEAVMDVLVQHMTADPPRVSTHRPDVPAAFDEPVLRMLAKDPASRPPTVMAAFEGLLAAAEQSGLRAPTASLAPRVPRSATLEPLSRHGGDVPAAHARTQAVTGGEATVRDVAVREMTGRAVTPGEVPPVGPQTSPPARNNRWGAPLALVGFMVLGAGATLALGLGRRAGSSTPLVPPSSSPLSGMGAVALRSAEPTAAPSSMPSAVSSGTAEATNTAHSANAATVSLRVDVDPPGALVYLGSTSLGAAPGPFQLARSVEPVTLTVKAPGYTAAQLVVIPSSDLARSTRLTRMRGPAPSRSAPSLNRDLEPF